MELPGDYGVQNPMIVSRQTKDIYIHATVDQLCNGQSYKWTYMEASGNTSAQIPIQYYNNGSSSSLVLPTSFLDIGLYEITVGKISYLLLMFYALPHKISNTQVVEVQLIER